MTSFYYLIMLTLWLQACTPQKKTISSHEKKSTIVINCKNSSIPASYITGKVTYINTQEEILHATVILRDLKTFQLIERVLTDEHGNFKLKNIPLGHYNLSINYQGCDDADMNLNFDEYCTCSAEIKLALYSITF